jgi:hypothetical protein
MQCVPMVTDRNDEMASVRSLPDGNAVIRSAVVRNAVVRNAVKLFFPHRNHEYTAVGRDRLELWLVS